MRWWVEISDVGRGEVLDELCLEATHWQPVLKRVRAVRGEGDTLEGLAVEFLDEGCQAIDAEAGVKYVVSPAADDEPLSDYPQAPAPVRVSRAPERPVASRRAGLGAERPSRAPAASMRPAARVALDYDSIPATPPAGTPIRTSQLPRAPQPVRVSQAPRAAQPEPAPRSRRRTFELLTSRTTPATERMPLTHHEHAFGLHVALADDALESFALERLAEVRAELVGARTGNVVDLAVFASPFSGLPDEPPVLALRWCDWREEPEVRLQPYAVGSDNVQEEDAPAPVEAPARRSVSPFRLADDAPTQAQPAEPARRKVLPKAGTLKIQTLPAKVSPQQTAAAAIQAKRAAAAAAAAARELPKPTATAAEPARRSVAPKPSQVPAASRRGVAAPAATSTRTVVSAAGEAAPRSRSVVASDASFEAVPTGRASQPPPSRSARMLSRDEKDAKFVSARDRASVVPPAPVRAGMRVSGDQLLTDMFEALSDLNYLGDALEAAAFVLSVTLEKLPCEVGMVSLFDLDRREYLVVRQQGGHRSALLLRGPETGGFAEIAMKAKRTIVSADPDAIASKLDVRWQETGVSPFTFACAPVLLGGRTLGLLELANPIDGGEFEAGDANALTYIGQQFAEFLDGHGLLLDADTVLAAAQVDARH